MKSDNWIGYIYEHIVIAESVIGRYLKNNEVVHHLNGIRDDNRIENLIVLERGQHIKLHLWINSGAPYKGINLTTSNKKPKKINHCLICNNITPYNNVKYCSKECNNISIKSKIMPTKEQLTLDLKNLKTWVSVGKKYNVSDNAVRKWAKKYGLSI